jgi:hypothetical protein
MRMATELDVLRAAVAHRALRYGLVLHEVRALASGIGSVAGGTNGLAPT